MYTHHLCFGPLTPYAILQFVGVSDPILTLCQWVIGSEGTTQRTIRVPEPRPSQQVAPTTLIRYVRLPMLDARANTTFLLTLTSLVSSLLILPTCLHPFSWDHSFVCPRFASSHERTVAFSHWVLMHRPNSSSSFHLGFPLPLLPFITSRSCILMVTAL